MLLSVLSIIGAVLKWILFVILGIIALVLLLVILICSSSFTYRAKGSKEDKNIQVSAKAGYLLSLVRVLVDFKDKKLSWKAMVAWKQVAGSETPEDDKNEGDKGKGNKTEKTSKKAKKKADKYMSHGDLEVESLSPQDKAAPEIAAEKEAESEGEKVAEADAEKVIEADANKETEAVNDKVSAAEMGPADISTELTEEEASVKKKNILQRLEDKGKETVSTWRETQKEKQRLKEEAAAKKAEEKARKEKEKQEIEQAKAAAKAEAAESRKQKLAELPDKIFDVVDAILDAPDKIDEIIDEKIAPKYEKFEKYYRLFDKYPRKKETLLAILQLVIDILKQLVPKRYEMQVDYGSDDPFKAAKTLGRFYAFSPLLLPKQNKRHHLEFTADMENKKLDFDGDIRGRFSINSLLVFPVLKALFNRDIQRLIRFVLKLRKKKDEAKKQVAEETIEKKG